MSNQSSNISLDHLKWAIGAIVVPILGVIIFVVNLGTKVTERLEKIDEKVDGVIMRQDKTDGKLSSFQGQIDTIKTRQLQYHYENKIYQAEQKAKR